VAETWGKTGEFFRLFRATILPANGQMTQEYKNHLQIHFTSSQWIKRIMNSGPEMVIWSVAVVEFWICGRDLGQKQVSFSDFRATILPANGQMTQEYKNNLQIHFTSSQWIKRMINSGPDKDMGSLAVVEFWICG
jgi:hypothetical protein